MGQTTNDMVRSFSALIDVLSGDNSIELLSGLAFSWRTCEADKSSLLFKELIDRDLAYIDATGNGFLNRHGQLFMSRVSIDFCSQLLDQELIADRFVPEKIINNGKNSVSLLVKHKMLGKRFVLKFVRPGAAENLTESIKIIASETVPASIVQPEDYFTIEIKDILEKKIEVDCIAFPYFEGTTFSEYLSNRTQPLTPQFLLGFIAEVGGALSHLEKCNAYHGDLHLDNILITHGPGDLTSFKILDISYGLIGSRSAQICHDDDIEMFRKHIWNILNTQRIFLSRMSLRKFLGAKPYFLTQYILNNKSVSFSGIISKLRKNDIYESFKERSSNFITSKFQKPDGLKLLRHEEITDPSVAVKLFEPYPDLKNNIEKFGNGLISGHRGSGKSTYLASLAYLPALDEPITDFKRIFGVYFACRQGEFRQFSSDHYDYIKFGYMPIKHTLIIKIIRRTLELISEGVNRNKINDPLSTRELHRFLERLLGSDSIPEFGQSAASRLDNLLSAVVRSEMAHVEALRNTTDLNANKRFSDEQDLYHFYNIIKQEFSDFSLTRFYVLFDDAGQPNIPGDFQKIINDLIISSNSTFCVKLSAEKFTYDFSSALGKHLEPGHDYTEHDISRTLLIGGGKSGRNKRELENYFRKIVSKRLEIFGYRSSDIVDYLGKTKIPYDELLSRLAHAKRNAYYCGWENVWMIADRTPRSLIEIISEIFSISNIGPSTDPKVVTPQNQHKAIQIISEKRYKALSLISGTVQVNGESQSLGRVLQKTTAALGNTFRTYLRLSKHKERKDQYLAIERNDFSELSESSDFILKKLIGFGIVDDSKLEISRDDSVKKPVYVLNRIFCPNFGIGLSRDQHLRLSRQKFEMLLLDPEEFLKSGTARLAKASEKGNSGTPDLFDEY